MYYNYKLGGLWAELGIKIGLGRQGHINPRQLLEFRILDTQVTQQLSIINGCVSDFLCDLFLIMH